LSVSSVKSQVVKTTVPVLEFTESTAHHQASTQLLVQSAVELRTFQSTSGFHNKSSFQSNAVCVADDTGLLTSEVLSTFGNHTNVLSTSVLLFICQSLDIYYLIKFIFITMNN